MKRKIAVITGTRADYGIYYHVLKEIEASKKLELMLVVCGMHLCPQFGLTIKEIEKDGFKIYDSFDTILASDTGSAMAKSIGLAIMNMAQSFERLKPDLVLILGDRGEMIAAAIVANHMNIPVAHIHGGEVTGTVDESIRHAITKLAHVHFPATQDSKVRIIRMGENPENVFVVGAPGIDYINNAVYFSKEELYERFHLKDEKYFIMTQHPVTTEIDNVKSQITETLNAVVKAKVQTIITYPNSDSGGREIVNVIEEYVKKYSFLKAFKNLSQTEYLSILKYASLMIGNSSSGIIEAASFKLPVINIGTRQEGRLRDCNVLDVDYNEEAILNGINTALNDSDFKTKLSSCTNLYGDGKAAKKIVSHLENIKLGNDLVQKKIRY